MINILMQRMHELGCKVESINDKLKHYHESLEGIVEQRTEELAEEKELLDTTLSCMCNGIIAVDTERKIAHGSNDNE